MKIEGLIGWCAVIVFVCWVSWSVTTDFVNSHKPAVAKHKNTLVVKKDTTSHGQSVYKPLPKSTWPTVTVRIDTPRSIWLSGTLKDGAVMWDPKRYFHFSYQFTDVDGHTNFGDAWMIDTTFPSQRRMRRFVSDRVKTKGGPGQGVVIQAIFEFKNADDYNHFAQR